MKNEEFPCGMTAQADSLFFILHFHRPFVWFLKN